MQTFVVDFMVDPSHFDVVLVQGKDSERFLQGQLTCDVAALAENKCVRGSCCNNKGRVIATFHLVRHQGNFYLCMAHGLGRLLLEALCKYLPFYKCTMTVLDASQPLSAHAGARARQLCQRMQVNEPAAGQVVAISSGWLCQLDAAPARVLLWQNAAIPVQDAPEQHAHESWEVLDLLQGIYPFRTTDSGLFTPQELHLDRNDYISFSKGCYTGQEIVARLHYRGKQKRALFLVTCEQSLAITAGQQSSVQVSGTEFPGKCLLTRSLGSLNLALLELPADFAGIWTSLTVAGTTIQNGCLFEQKVIQLANLFSFQEAI